MSAIVPCIWFDDQAEQAAAFYAKTFPSGRVVAVSHYPKSSDNPSKKPAGSVLTVELEIAGQRFTALNGGPQFVPNASISFFVNVKTAAEVNRLFAALVEGGKALMPLGSYPWSDRYGWVQDRFGVTWQVMMVPTVDHPQIVPSLMFSDAQKGRAEEAMKAYTSVLPNGRIEHVERFGAGEGPEGTVKHGRFVVAGQVMAVMDSPVDHGFGFNEALSLQVLCEDQAEVDRLWDAMSEGGEKGPCGWLKDRFGVSWQIVPKSMVAWLMSDDEAARDRAFAAMLTMKKLDIAALERAFSGAT